jgi:hypothetical protein
MVPFQRPSTELRELVESRYFCLADDHQIVAECTTYELIEECCSFLRMQRRWETLFEKLRMCEFRPMSSQFTPGMTQFGEISNLNFERLARDQFIASDSLDAARYSYFLHDAICSGALSKVPDSSRANVTPEESRFLKALLEYGKDRNWISTSQLGEKSGLTSRINLGKCRRRLKAKKLIESKSGCGVRITRQGIQVVLKKRDRRSKSSSEDFCARSHAFPFVWLRDTSRCFDYLGIEEPTHDVKKKSGAACPTVSSS